MQLTDRADINQAKGDVTLLPETIPMATYMRLLKETVKAGGLYKNVAKGLTEKKKVEDFKYRFTGK